MKEPKVKSADSHISELFNALNKLWFAVQEQHPDRWRDVYEKMNVIGLTADAIRKELKR